MEFRIYTGIYSESTIDGHTDSIMKRLGEARINEGKLVKSGLVTIEMLSSLNPPDKYMPQMEKIRDSFSTFEMTNDWILFSYFSSKQMKHRTAQGSLYAAGLYPHEESDTYDTTTLLTVGYNQKSGIVCLLVNAGRTEKNQFDGLVSDMSVAFEASSVPHPLVFEEHQIKKLASIYIADKYHIASSTVDVATSKVAISHMQDIFSDREIQDADQYLKIEEKIHSGNWKSIAFHVTQPEYYLYVSKSKSSSLGVLPSVGDKIKRTLAIPIIDHIVTRINRIPDFSVYQTRLT